MTRQRSLGFIDFTDMDGSGNPDAWRDDPAGGKLVIHKSKPCHETHPELDIGGGILLGGNCRDHERHADVDLYVALDYGMAHPKFEVGKTPARCIYYPIENMKTPHRPDKFAALIDHIVGELAKGARVHVGCIGGHGRTGLVIGAVVARLGIAEDADAIGWVRQNYCQRAIETSGQENFLVVHFGAKMPPAKVSTGVDKRTKGR